MEICFIVASVIHYIVAAVQDQITSMKFAQYLQRHFHLCGSLYENNSITMIKQSQK